VRLPSALIQPVAADDVASAVGRTAMGSPVNGTVQIGGPEKFPLDELARRGLAAWRDPREVVADPHARYFGIELSEKTLLLGDDAQLGETRFETWLSQPEAKAASGAHGRTPQCFGDSTNTCIAPFSLVGTNKFPVFVS
jgi:uncharacterized protein YbjT (DUF2867 family)